MDAQKTIKKYILPRTMTVISSLLVVIGLVLAVLGITARGNADTEAQLFYPNESETGSMAYIDVVGVSDWLYQNDDAVYYTALDNEGYLFTVRLTSSQFKDLAPQFDYWMDESENAVPPAPFRLEGLVRDVTSDIRSTLAECWELTTVEYDQLFGTKFIDATTNSGTEAMIPWLLGALFTGLIGIAFLAQCIQANSNAKKCLRRLEELGLTERAAQQVEMADSNTIIGKNRGMLSHDFLFGKGSGMVVPYYDILWAYQLDRRYNFIPVNSYLMIGTKEISARSAMDLNRIDKHGYIAEAMDTIAQRNPDTIIGYSRDNAKAYNAIRKGK